jgi:hypothetical protein
MLITSQLYNQYAIFIIFTIVDWSNSTVTTSWLAHDDTGSLHRFSLTSTKTSIVDEVDLDQQ